MKTPSDEPAHELLHEFAIGALGAEDAAAFREHLQHCEECRAEMDFIESVQSRVEKDGPEFMAEHPSSERLVGAVMGQLDEEATREVMRHIELCDACAKEARWVRGEATAGAEGRATARPTRSVPWGWIAAAAATIALLAVLLPQDDPRSSATGVVTPEYVLPTERAELEGKNVYRLLPDQPATLLTFDVDLGPGSFPIELEIEDAAGNAVASSPPLGLGRLRDGFLFFGCDRRECVPGSYTARIKANAAAEPDLVFKFEIVNASEDEPPREFPRPD